MASSSESPPTDHVPTDPPPSEPQKDDLKKSWQKEVLGTGTLPNSSDVRFKAHPFGDMEKKR